VLTDECRGVAVTSTPRRVERLESEALERRRC